jgi:hypothetical protein
VCGGFSGSARLVPGGVRLVFAERSAESQHP